VVHRTIPDLPGRPVNIIAGQRDLASHRCAKVRGGKSGLGHLARRCHLNLPIVRSGESESAALLHDYVEKEVRYDRNHCNKTSVAAAY
jgi:hypothetical protein